MCDPVHTTCICYFFNNTTHQAGLSQTKMLRKYFGARLAFFKAFLTHVTLLLTSQAVPKPKRQAQEKSRSTSISGSKTFRMSTFKQQAEFM